MDSEPIGPRNRKITVAYPVQNPTFVLPLEGAVTDLCHIKASNGPSSRFVVGVLVSNTCTKY